MLGESVLARSLSIRGLAGCDGLLCNSQIYAETNVDRMNPVRRRPGSLEINQRQTSHSRGQRFSDLGHRITVVGYQLAILIILLTKSVEAERRRADVIKFIDQRLTNLKSTGRVIF